MEIPKILQAKRNGEFYDYCEKLLDTDPIYGNMSPAEISSEHQKSLMDYDEIIGFEPVQFADRYEELA